LAASVVDCFVVIVVLFFGS